MRGARLGEATTNAGSRTHRGAAADVAVTELLIVELPVLVHEIFRVCATKSCAVTSSVYVPRARRWATTGFAELEASDNIWDSWGKLGGQNLVCVAAGRRASYFGVRPRTAALLLPDRRSPAMVIKFHSKYRQRSRSAQRGSPNRRSTRCYRPNSDDFSALTQP